MKMLLFGWFFVYSALPGADNNTYIFREPKRNIDVLVVTDKSYTEGAWVQIKGLAKCQKDWDYEELRWESFCVADSFEEIGCSAHNIFPLNGIIYC